MTDVSQTYAPEEISSPTLKIKVRICAMWDQSLFHVTFDNRIVCSTCKAYVTGWHAIGDTYAS